jgi:hypothetical protein
MLMGMKTTTTRSRTMEQIKIVLDEENNGDTNLGSEYANFWEYVRQGGPQELQVTEAQGKAFVAPERFAKILTWCEKTPGWYGGAEFAPHPIAWWPEDVPTEEEVLSRENEKE